MDIWVCPSDYDMKATDRNVGVSLGAVHRNGDVFKLQQAEARDGNMGVSESIYGSVRKSLAMMSKCVYSDLVKSHSRSYMDSDTPTCLSSHRSFSV